MKNNYVISDLNIIQVNASTPIDCSNCFWRNLVDIEVQNRNEHRDVMYSMQFYFAENAKGMWYKIWPRGEAFLHNPFFDIASSSLHDQSTPLQIELRKYWHSIIVNLLSHFISLSEHGCWVFTYLGNEHVVAATEMMPLSLFIKHLLSGKLQFNKQYYVFLEGKNEHNMQIERQEENEKK